VRQPRDMQEHERREADRTEDILNFIIYVIFIITAVPNDTIRHALPLRRRSDGRPMRVTRLSAGTRTWC